MYVRDLLPGAQFRVLSRFDDDGPGLTLVRLGMGSAIVRGPSEARSFESRDGEMVEFTAPGRVYTISLGTLAEETAPTPRTRGRGVFGGDTR